MSLPWLEGRRPSVATRLSGGLALLGLLGATWFVAVAWPRLELRSHHELRVRLTWSGGLRPGVPVYLGGAEVGRVVRLETLVDGVRVVTRVRAAGVVGLAAKAEAYVATQGMFGARRLELCNCGAAPQPRWLPGIELVGTSPVNLDRSMARLWQSMQQWRELSQVWAAPLAALRQELQRWRTGLDELPIVALQDAVAELRQQWHATSPMMQPVAHLRLGARLARLEAQTARLMAVLPSWQAQGEGLYAALASIRGGALATAAARMQVSVTGLGARVAQLQAKVELLAASIAARDGSLLRILYDPEFPEDTKELGKIIKRSPWRVVSPPPPPPTP